MVVMIILIAVTVFIANRVLSHSARKNERRSRLKMNTRGQMHGLVDNSPSVGAVAVVSVVIIVGAIVMYMYLPYVQW